MWSPQTLEPVSLSRTAFLPGATTDGHYQIELSCESCHSESWSDQQTLQDACVSCHAAELELVDDSHPRTKFTDPRNADRVAVLDARWCVTCHQEHRPEVTSTMGLSLPGDYCYRCHADVGDERPTHRDLPFDGCASGGCHNFHDNQALYEDFLVEHREEPRTHRGAWVHDRELLEWAQDEGLAGASLVGAESDAPASLRNRDIWVAEWEGTSHARAGVNCSGCHTSDAAAWVERPGPEACASCHAGEHEGFLASRHGMRLAAGLPPMRPDLARLPMHGEAHGEELACQSCHGAHAYDTRFAATEACQQCHADEHTLAYDASTHARLWREELAGTGLAGSGVSCATCHLPRVELAGQERIAVAHNQNDFLRPNEKMIGPVCMSCHGLGFALSSLADPDLVRRNFVGLPAREVESIHYAATLRWELEGELPPWKEEER